MILNLLNYPKLEGQIFDFNLSQISFVELVTHPNRLMPHIPFELHIYSLDVSKHEVLIFDKAMEFLEKLDSIDEYIIPDKTFLDYLKYKNENAKMRFNQNQNV